MPWAEEAEPDAGVRVPVGREAAPARPSLSGLDVAGAAFRTENPVVAVVRAATAQSFPPQNGYLPGDDASKRYSKLFGRYPDNFIGSVGPEDTDARAARLKEYEDDRERIADAGWGGVVATAGAGLLSPEQWIVPGGALVKAGKVGWSVGKTALAVGAGAAAQQAVAETVLHSANPVRGWDESAMNIGVATLAGGMLGAGASAWLNAGERRVLNAKLAADRTARTEHATGVAPAGPRHEVEISDRGNGSFFAQSVTDPGDLLSLKVGPDAVYAGIATIGRAVRGTGLGTALYERAIQFAAERGLPFRSDISVNADALRVYESLRRRGYEVTEAPGTTATKAGATNASAGYVFEVRPPREAPGPGKSVGDLVVDRPAAGPVDGELLPANVAAREVVGEGVAARAAGAAPTDTAEARLAGVFQGARTALAQAAPGVSQALEAGWARAASWVRPAWDRVAPHIGTDLGLFSSPSAAVRRAAAEHVETALVLQQNLAGEVTSNVIPLDRAIRSVKGRLVEKVADNMREIFSRYYFGRPDAKLAQWRGTINDFLGMTPDSKLSPAQFDREVVAALNTGDDHAIPEVAEAAKMLRAEVFDPLAQWMERVNPNFKRMDFAQGESYAPRKWLASKIEAMPNEFVEQVLLPHLASEQKVKAAAKDRIIGLNEKLNTAQDMTERFDDMLERLDAREDALRARLSERAMEVERTGAREQALQERASSAAEDVTETQDLIDRLRRDVSDPALLQRVDTLEKDLSELRRQERPVTQANLEQIEREELGGILTGTNRMAAEMLVGRRKFPKAPSFVSWLVANGGLKDVGGDVASVLGRRKNARPGLINQRGREFDEMGEKIANEFPGAFPEANLPGGGRPDRQQILAWIDESLRGREPDWWLQNMSNADRQALDAAKTAGILDRIFQEAGIDVKKVSDVAKVLRDERPGNVGLEDLDRIAGQMEEAGQDVPISFRREGVETELTATREDIANARAMIQRARDAKVSRETRARTAEAVSAEAGLAERANRGRLGVLEDRLSLADQRRDLLHSSREIFEAEEARIRATIEDELAKWQGKTTNEVRSELKARDKYAADRALAQQEFGPQQPGAREGPRLQTADRAVDRAVRHIIDSDRDLSIDELRSKAEEIRNHITGLPIGRLPYDNAAVANAARNPALASARGPLLPRDFNVPYDVAKEWIDHDLENTLSSYTRTMIPDAILWERHPGEGPDRPSFYRTLELDYDNLIREAKTEKEKTRLAASKKRDIETLHAVTERERGLMNNTVGMSGRVGEAVRRLNQMADLGGAAVSGLTDFAGPVLEHGLWSWFKEGIAPYFTHLAGSDLVSMSNKELKALGIGGEMEGAARMHAMTEQSDAYSPHTRAEIALKHASNSFFYLNLQNQTTQQAKRMAGRVAMSNLLDAVEAQVAGKATKVQTVKLAQANLTPELAERIWAEFTKDGGGNIVDGVKLSNTDAWADAQAKEFYIAAIGRDVDRAVITPGAAKPIWLSTNVGSLLGQYKSFALAATTKVLVSGLQQGDARLLQAITAQMGLGAMVYAAKTAYRGEEFKKKPAEWIKESMHYAMFPGIIEDANLVADKFSGGRLNYHRLYGAEKPVSRGRERSASETLLGPTVGKLNKLSQIGGALGTGNWNANDVHALRGLFAGQNVPGLQRLFNDAENGFNHAFGISPRKDAPTGIFTRP